MAPTALEFRTGTWDFARPYVCGVVNVTPDSFSDGGLYHAVDAAVARARQLIADGADLIDIGGESTRPGAAPVGAAAEIERVVPVIRALSGVAVPLSVDTTKAAVAEAALAAGAEVVNDVSGGRFDPAIREVATHASAYVCGHLRGESILEVHAREAESPAFEAVLIELRALIDALPAQLRSRTIADPGLGFGKRLPENVELCKRAGDLSSGLQCAVMVGASRKRFVSALSGHGAPVGLAELDSATVGVSLAAVAAGAHIVRVHNVACMAPALRAYSAVAGGAV